MAVGAYDLLEQADLSMTRKGMLRGSKFNARHQTVIPDAEPFILKAKAISLVTKISIGVITPLPVSTTWVKIMELDHALRVNFRGKNAVQTFYIYGSDLAAIKSQLEKSG